MQAEGPVPKIDFRSALAEQLAALPTEWNGVRFIAA
jgi:hypothetical protein